MLIYFGADHRGFAFKEQLKPFVQSMGYEINDLGAAAEDPEDDYPDYAIAVAREVSADPLNRKGVLICGSGAGMAIVANKFRGVRAVHPSSNDEAYAARHDDDANILVIAADFTKLELAQSIARVFFMTAFGTDERYARRIRKINDAEAENV
ncbi:MAG: hypothetical protein RL681_669 [Candidatus Parcubacteria bacterium]|jgi:ribose 5-phosphate isomerase B